MKIMLYESTATMNFIPIKYEGYRSIFFKDHNNPKNDLEDYKKYITEPLNIPDNKPDNLSKYMANYYPIKLTDASKFEDTFLLHREPLLFSNNNFILSCIFVLNNIKKKGSALLKLDNISCIVDCITIMAQFFNSCQIIKGNSRYILLEKFIDNKQIRNKFITFLKYYYESNKTIRALETNEDEARIKAFLIKK